MSAVPDLLPEVYFNGSLYGHNWDAGVGGLLIAKNSAANGELQSVNVVQAPSYISSIEWMSVSKQDAEIWIQAGGAVYVFDADDISLIDVHENVATAKPREIIDQSFWTHYYLDDSSVGSGGQLPVSATTSFVKVGVGGWSVGRIG